MGFKRKTSRVEFSRGGRLQRGALSAAYKVLDVSETGVRIESRLFVKSGDALQLAIELEQGRTLSCGLQVVHVRSPRFGAKVTSISSEDRERLTRILTIIYKPVTHASSCSVLERTANSVQAQISPG